MSQMTLAMFIRERIIAALNVRDARDATDPVDAIFPRRQRGGSVHEIHRYRRKAGEVRVRRRLERPFGSVRWRADSPDPRQDTIGYLGP